MKKQRKHYTPEEKVTILRRYLLEREPNSKLCDELGLQPTVFYRWQKEKNRSDSGALGYSPTAHQEAFAMRRWLGIACVITLSTIFLRAWQGSGPDEREPAQGTVWDLTPLFPDAAAWDRERQQLEAALPGLATLKGSLGVDPKSLQSGLDRISALRQRLHRLDTYARLKADEDARVEENRARVQVITGLDARFDETTAFVTPEILALGREKIESYEKQNPGLKRYERPLELLLRKQAHTLTPEAESVLAAAGALIEQPRAILDALLYADMPWPSIQAGSQQIRVDPQKYPSLMTSPDRELRRKAFEAFMSTLGSYQRTLGAVYAAHLSGATFEAKARHYPSSLAMALADDAMPEAPFRALLTETRKSLPAIHRYVQARQRMLHVDEMHIYDLLVPLVDDPHHYQLDEAEDTILKALAPLGDDYVKALASAFRGHSMHAIAHPGKPLGAYTNDEAYSVPPYVLVTFTGTSRDVSMIAHEWGHAMHSRLAQAAQPFETSRYSTFVADAPSLTNEMLLNDYWIAQAKTRQEKILALSQAIDLLRATYFVTGLGAQFELAAHEASDRGEPLTGRRFSEMYCGLLRPFYGNVVKVDDSACAIWAIDPLLSHNFYTYKYMIATSAAAYFVEGLERNDAGLRARYFELLKSGGSDDPYVLLKRAGFDPASGAAYQPMIQRLERLVDQLEAVLAQPD
jgi:oligoendopeptidase F